MGAAGSVEQGLEGGAVASKQRIEDQLVDQSEAVQEGVEQAETMTNEITEGAEKMLDDGISEISELVGDQKDHVVKIMESARGHMDPEQVTRAVKDIKDIILGLEGAAIAVAVAGSITAVTQLAPEVVANVSVAVLALGEHLPFLGVAAGAIGAIAFAFKMSKDQDENAQVVSLWMHSVKDWLMLVAGKVERSSAESTLPLFKGLQDALVSLCNYVHSHQQKWRITKMLGSARFEQDFSGAKGAVVELKNALRDFLDEETQNRQEAALANISSAQLETSEKLASMDDQLTQIRQLLLVQEQQRVADAAKLQAVQEAEAMNVKKVREEEEEIYAQIMRSVGLPTEGAAQAKFNQFVYVFETFFFNGADMPAEQKRGLKVAIDKDGTGTVSKPAWIKFYRHWTESGLNVEEYLVKVADDNPTMFMKGAKCAEVAAIAAKQKAVEYAKSKGVETVDDAKALVAAKAADLSNFGSGLFGRKVV
jgi:hypothetical protein